MSIQVESLNEVFLPKCSIKRKKLGIQDMFIFVLFKYPINVGSR